MANEQNDGSGENCTLFLKCSEQTTSVTTDIPQIDTTSQTSDDL
uniref:Uncharacterized protein n=1 Tax=Anguilla anguilla TaxID=7936 RepID=A0A0E9S1Z0_ANGAN